MMVHSADQSISENVYNLRVYLFILLSLSVFSCTGSYAFFWFILHFPTWVSSKETSSTPEVNIDENVNV